MLGEINLIHVLRKKWITTVMGKLGFEDGFIAKKCLWTSGQL